jgi:hypothetical protein
VVDVCFLCAPDWKETRALEDVSRNQDLKGLEGLDARHATYDARSRAFAKLPLAARTALVEYAFPSETAAAGCAAETSVEPVPIPVEPFAAEDCANGADSTADSAADIADIAAVAASAAETAESLTADLLRKTRAAEAIKAKKRGARAFAADGGFDEDPDAADADAADTDADGIATVSNDDPARDPGAREAAAIVAALRRRGDDVDAAMRDTRDARGEEVADAFALRTIGDADDAAARAAERDRARLDEVMRRDGGAYPLRRSVRYSTSDGRRSSVDGVVSEANGSELVNMNGGEVLPDFYDTEEKREAALREKAKNRDAVTVAVAAEEETTRLAEEASRREARASEEARDAKRDRERRKLEKWAAVGVDVAEYAPPGFEIRDSSFFFDSRIDGVERGVRAYAASPRRREEETKEDDTKDAAVEEADGAVSVGKNKAERKGAEARDEKKTKPAGV